VSLPKEISALVRAAARVVAAYRDLKRAKADVAPEPTRAKYRKALSAALEALDRAVVAVAKSARQAPPESGKPFDWGGPLRAALQGIKLVNELRGAVRGPAPRVGEVIDAEIIE
jgi:hypothetical protein